MFTNLRTPTHRVTGLFFVLYAALVLPHCGDDSGDDGHATGGAASGGAISDGGAKAMGGKAPALGGATSEGGSAGAGLGGTIADGGSLSTTGGDSPGGAGGVGGTTGLGGAAPTMGGQAGAGGSGGEGGSSIVPPEGGAAGAPDLTRPDFMLGADISWIQEDVDLGATYVDTDGETKTILPLLANHGFNTIRLRTFVDPMNVYGYANMNGEVNGLKAEPYCDLDHTIEFAREVKDAGMKLIVDLHYSDFWADPGKQIIPERWRSVTTIDELATNVGTYTQDVVQRLVDAGARPDIVQVGNEITPGMLIQVPSGVPNKADPWSMTLSTNTVNGSIASFANLSKLLKKGADGVHAVDPSIQIMLHIENTGSPSGVIGWVNAVRNQGVAFDVLGLSCYTKWQGAPSVWEGTFKAAAKAFPDLHFMIAEYGPEPRRANEIIRDLPNKQGIGTLIWEPTHSGTWGPGIFLKAADVYTANPTSFAVYDSIRAEFAIP